MKVLNISTYKCFCNVYLPKLVKEEERKATEEIYACFVPLVYNYSHNDYLHSD